MDKEEYKKGKREVDCCPVCGNVCPNCHLGGGACSCCDCPDEEEKSATPPKKT